MNMLDKAAEWLASKMLTHASQTVTYVRSTGSTPVTAAIGRTTFDVDDGYGNLTRWESRDFLISKADLIGSNHDQDNVWPVAGDTIHEDTGADAALGGDHMRYTYQVMAPAGEALWEYADAYRNLIRVHTKKVDRKEVQT
tara:strand:+ start:1301 stop:1720 length:420 start_codon:yes stop_codon:yes gene_type:complete